MKKRKPEGHGAEGSGALRERDASDPRGEPRIGAGREAPIEDPESPPVERSRTPDELERETVVGREDRASQAGRDTGRARE